MDDRCKNCGACKHCGNGGRQFSPYPVYPQPYWGVQPYRFYPPTWVSPNTVYGTGQTFTTGSTTNIQ